MKWIYILILLVVAASALGCVDKKQVETPGQQIPAQTVSPGEESGAVKTPAAPFTEVTQAPDDLFGTESNLSAIDTTFNDMNMEISLLDTI